MLTTLSIRYDCMLFADTNPKYEPIFLVYEAITVCTGHLGVSPCPINIQEIAS